VTPDAPWELNNSGIVDVRRFRAGSENSKRYLLFTLPKKKNGSGRRCRLRSLKVFKTS
jgi:hypothetical protein